MARTRHYDASFVSEDPRFAHAHITALGPFDPDPDAATLAEIGEIAAATPAIDVTLERIEVFPDGIIHLAPDPAAPFEQLTARLVEKFPDYPPYAGIHGPTVAPHLTLDALSDVVTIASTRSLLGGVLPTECRIDRLQLAWWQSDGCRVLAEWSLGG